MSASRAAKFTDHYAILSVDPGVDDETLQRAYAKLVEKFGPHNIDTRDDAKMAIIHAAYETLSDPEKRQEFDAIKGLTGNLGRPMFMGIDFFDVLGREVGLRSALLCILYDRRRNSPTAPAISMRHVEGMLAASVQALEFALWYLKQRNFVENDEKSSLQITVEGMDFLESNRPKPEDVMPFIKASAIADRKPPAKFAPAKLEADSTLDVLAHTSSGG